MELIKVEDPSSGKKVEFNIDLGADLDDMIGKYGAAVVHFAAREKMKTKAMNAARGLLKRGIEPDVVAKRMETEWQPVRRLNRTTMSVSLEDLSSLSDDEVDSILNSL